MVIYLAPLDGNGGVLQFSTTFARETASICDYRLFLADTISADLYEEIADKVVIYKKPKTLNSFDSRIKELAEKIASFSPDLVFFTEDNILAQQVNAYLYKMGINTAIVIHDILPHPYRNRPMRFILVDILRRKMMKKTIHRCSNIILLSENSKSCFKKQYKADNCAVFKLPAHVPNVNEQPISELKDCKPSYFLFFGRIDKYKGLENLCKAYTSLPEDFKKSYELVIAGKGAFSENELSLINSDAHIHMVNRFIDDGEMIWLYKNCNSVVLPYIEASQSGVLPIAYKFSKPVVVSNLQGLTENVLENKTGLVCNTVDELPEKLMKIPSLYDEMKPNIDTYYKENYSWDVSIKKLFKQII